ncbi:RES family NAD+ phosphorylase [Deinococcus marmoris]|uniref:RES family NAD+ phosphorylase n=1 Tax=Deinococcus marmoris TaxID=249408 RepID=UPI0009DEC727|nr:RES family NAD+ phosphorylase [Deinococcus marmoris]
MIPQASLKDLVLSAPIRRAELLWCHRSVSLDALLRYGGNALDPGGSLVTGGRYNPREGQGGAYAALYLADHAATAHSEIGGLLRNLDGTLGRDLPTPPRVDIDVEIDQPMVLDLTDAATLTHLRITRSNLDANWKIQAARGQLALTQNLGAAAHQAGIVHAVRFYSTKLEGGINHALLPAGQHLARVWQPDGEIDRLRALIQSV